MKSRKKLIIRGFLHFTLFFLVPSIPEGSVPTIPEGLVPSISEGDGGSGDDDDDK